MKLISASQFSIFVFYIFNFLKLLLYMIFFHNQLQQAEAEELRQKEANLTALAAIGPRKKRKLDFSDSSTSGVSS